VYNDSMPVMTLCCCITYDDTSHLTENELPECQIKLQRRTSEHTVTFHNLSNQDVTSDNLTKYVNELQRFVLATQRSVH